MLLHLDEHGRVPIYCQITDQVKALVQEGILKPGEQLPTVREVAAELRVNFNTVARAYRQLHDEGVISSQQGRGTYVMERRPSPAVEISRDRQLARMVTRWLDEAERQGFTRDEIEQAWQQLLGLPGQQRGSAAHESEEG
jgi:GntR family transcriptional regulator